MTVTTTDSDIDLDLPLSVSDNMKKEDQIEKILVIGIGGAGNNAVDYLYNQKDYMETIGKSVTHYVLNTDENALNNMKCENRIILGQNLLHGKGAGANINVGKQATEETRKEIEKICEGVDLVFLTAGMGGGTGTLGASVVAQIAKAAGAIVVSLVTLPYNYENRKVPAIYGIKALMNLSDSLITIDNQKIVSSFEDLDYLQGLDEANKILANAISGVIRVIRQPARINSDFEDLKTVLNSGGRSQIISKSVHGDILKGLKEDPDETINAIYQHVIDSPLISRSNIEDAKAILLYIECTKHFTQKIIDRLISKFSNPKGLEANDEINFDDLLDGVDFDIEQLDKLSSDRPQVIFAFDLIKPENEDTEIIEPRINVTVVATGMDGKAERIQTATQHFRQATIPEEELARSKDRLEHHAPASQPKAAPVASAPAKPATPAPAAQPATPSVAPIPAPAQVAPTVAPATPAVEAPKAEQPIDMLTEQLLKNPELLAQILSVVKQPVTQAEAPKAEPSVEKAEVKAEARAEEAKPAPEPKAEAAKVEEPKREEPKPRFEQPTLVVEPTDLAIDD